MGGEWCPTPGPACNKLSRTERLVVARTLEEVRERAAAVRSARKAMEAFAKAHQKLFEKFKSGDAGDLEAANEIFAIIKAVYDVTTVEDNDDGDPSEEDGQ